MGALIQGAVMALFLVLGKLHPRVPGVALVNRDLLWNLLNGVLLFGFRLTAVVWATSYLELGLWDPTPVLSAGWMQFLVAFVALDLSRYWLHRLGHRVPILWSFHRVHHSAEFLDASTGLRMHVVDFIQLSALPLILFSVLTDTSGLETWVLPAAMGVGVVMDAFQHANLAMDMTRPWNRAWNLLLNNPHFHSWHHTRDGALCDGNYSNTLIIWDRIFRSEVTRPVPPALYGLDGDQVLQNDVLSWQLLRPRAPAPTGED